MEVHIERAALSEGTVLIFKDYGTCVRMAYDPSRINGVEALEILSAHVPRIREGGQSAHRVGV